MHSTVVGITLSWGWRLIIVLQMYTGIEHLSTWMVGGGNLVSLCRSRRLQISKKRLEWSMGQWMRVGDTSLNSVSLTCRYSQSHVEIVYRQVQTHGLLHMHISLWRLSGLRSKDTPVTTSTCSTRAWFSILFFNKRSPCSMERWLIQGLGQGTYKMGLGVSIHGTKFK